MRSNDRLTNFILLTWCLFSHKTHSISCSSSQARYNHPST